MSTQDSVSDQPVVLSSSATVSVQRHLGVRRIFTVPGDFTLPLMHDMEQICGTGPTAAPPLPFILGLNELNSGYSADAYARLYGFSVLMVTFSVGSLSAINAIAGMYAENVPCLVLVGSPNSNSAAEGELVHHTLGETRYDYSRRMAREVTVHASSINRARDAPRLLHEAIEQCLAHHKPVYVEIGQQQLRQTRTTRTVLPEAVTHHCPPTLLCRVCAQPATCPPSASSHRTLRQALLLPFPRPSRLQA